MVKSYNRRHSRSRRHRRSHKKSSHSRKHNRSMKGGKSSYRNRNRKSRRIPSGKRRAFFGGLDEPAGNQGQPNIPPPPPPLNFDILERERNQRRNQRENNNVIRGGCKLPWCDPRSNKSKQEQLRAKEPIYGMAQHFPVSSDNYSQPKKTPQTSALSRK
jgi:hypothetical protein